MTKYLCIHGHFYQPPRENPWIEEIEQQESAAPYHDWNERILKECYEPNCYARIVDGNNRSIDIDNNYSLISFNFGPTLLSWLEKKAPDVYTNILEADRESLKRLGHGNAIAQAYNHTILPLVSRGDKITQIYWGIADFEHRFGRKPHVMWLPETAVDLETLSILADQGIEFTILAPWQAESEHLDPTESYRIDLPQGRSITAFFYHAELSSCVSFNPTLGEEWTRFVAVTSYFPFAAIAQGRNRLVWSEIGWRIPVVGLVLYALIFWLHPVAFGARPY